MQRRVRFLLALLAFVAPACGNDHLDLSIVLDDAMRARVARFVINVLEPSDPTWSCDGIAFDEHSDSALQSVLVATTSVTVGSHTEAALAVQRSARQLIVAYGYAEDGNQLVAGCGERAPGASATIAIRALRVALIAEPAPEELAGDAPGQLPAMISVTVRDALGEALPDTTVRWATDGPGSFARVDESQTDALGVARYVRQVGDLAGPYALRVRAPWTLGPNAAVESFEPLRTTTYALAGEPRQAFALGASRRPEGLPSVVGSVGNGTCALGVFAIADHEASVAAVSGCPTLVAAGVGDVDQVFLVTATAGTFQVSRIAAVNPVTVSDCGQVTLPASFESCKPAQVLDADPCGRSGRLMIGFACTVAPTGISSVVIDVATCPPVLVQNGSGFAQLPASAELVSTGCLDVNAVPTNMVVLRQDTRDILVSDKAPGAARRVKGPTTFYDFSVVAGRHVLLGSDTTNGSTALTVFAATDAGEEPYGVDALATFGVPSEPMAATSADVDGDGLLDVYGLVKGGGAARQRMLVCLGRAAGSAICASGPELRTDGHVVALVSDLDGNGFEDLVSLQNPGSGWVVQGSTLQERAP